MSGMVLYGPLFPSLGIHLFTDWINPVRIVTSGTGVLDVVPRLELFETLGAGIVDILSVGDELRRGRRSVGSRHFEWRTG